MQLRTRHAWLLAAVLVAACGSAAAPGSTAETAPGQGDQTADSPADPPADGGGGAIDAPAIADAQYTGGMAHIEVTGGKSLTTDAALVPGISMSTGGTTLLMYTAGEGQDAVVISISNGADTGLGMTISAAQLVTGGDGATGCGFDLTRNDDTGLTGTFSCRGISTVGLDMATIDVSGAFSAER